MSIPTLVKKYEDELVAVDGLIAALEDRKKLVKLLLAEIRKAAPGAKRSVRKTTPRNSTAPKARRKPKGGMTVKDAILKAVADAGAPLTSNGILAAAGKLSSGAVSSIRSEITHLATAGQLKKVKHSGRGFKYQLPK